MDISPDEKTAILSLFIYADDNLRKEMRKKYPWIPKRVNRRKQTEASRAESRKQGYIHKKDYTKPKFLELIYYRDSQKYYQVRGVRSVTFRKMLYNLTQVGMPIKVKDSETNENITPEVMQRLILTYFQQNFKKIPIDLFMELSYSLPKPDDFQKAIERFLIDVAKTAKEK